MDIEMTNIYPKFHLNVPISTWHGVVITAEKDWRGFGGFKLQCIRNYHFFCSLMFVNVREQNLSFFSVNTDTR